MSTKIEPFFTPFSLSIRKPYQVCLLIVVVFAIYYPAMSAEVSLLDDREAMICMFNVQHFDLNSLFFPRVKEGGYYRPFLGLSYLIDRFCWFLDSKIMHFENVVMHLLNSLMVFWVGVRLCRKRLNDLSLLPLFGALLFALHPINTESINWISGRTDPLACTFVLAALLLVLTYREQRKIRWLVAAFVMTVFGTFAKETALGFLPASIFIIMVEERRCDAGSTAGAPTLLRSPLFHYSIYAVLAFFSALMFANFYLVIVIGGVYWVHCLLVYRRNDVTGNLLKKFRTLLWVLMAFCLLAVMFYGLRKAAYVSNMSKMSNTFKVMFSDLNYSIELFLGAAGFYVKKFFVPIPLNLAIREIDPLYELLGVLCFVACIYLMNARRIAAALVLGGFMMLSPALPFVFGTIAWTGYAERYIYISSAFWILAGISYMSECPVVGIYHTHRFRAFVAGIILIVFAVITFQRNLLWQTNVAIFKDTVEKSPDFKNLRGLYISALFEIKDYDEAEKQYFIAKKLPSLAYDERYDLMYASLLQNKKKYTEAERVFSDIELKTKGKSTELYEAMIVYYDGRLFANNDQESVKLLRRNKIRTYEKLYDLNKSPYTSYRLGQEYIAAGDIKKARNAIKTAADQFENGDPLKKNANELLKSLDRKIMHDNAYSVMK